MPTRRDGWPLGSSASSAQHGVGGGGEGVRWRTGRWPAKDFSRAWVGPNCCPGGAATAGAAPVPPTLWHQAGHQSDPKLRRRQLLGHVGPAQRRGGAGGRVARRALAGRLHTAGHRCNGRTPRAAQHAGAAHVASSSDTASWLLTNARVSSTAAPRTSPSWIGLRRCARGPHVTRWAARCARRPPAARRARAAALVARAAGRATPAGASPDTELATGDLRSQEWAGRAPGRNPARWLRRDDAGGSHTSWAARTGSCWCAAGLGALAAFCSRPWRSEWRGAAHAVRGSARERATAGAACQCARPRVNASRHDVGSTGPVSNP